jgi:hypothetical protein
MANLCRPSDADKTAAAYQFLSDLFGSAAGACRSGGDPAVGAVVNIWTAPDRQSHFFPPDQLEAAAETAVALSADHDVYFASTLLHERVRGGPGRGVAADAVAIPALSADVDVAKLGAKKTYFPTPAAAVAFLLGLVLVPSLLVWTGGGYLASWLLRELWWFADPADHAAAAALLKRWQRYLQQQAKALGVAIDSTFDAARLLRIPGTINHKYGSLVVIERATERRYNPSDFEEFVAGIPADAAESGPIVSSGLRLDPLAQPPEPKFSSLVARSERFALSWDRERPDLADQSASAYDLSLASLAVRDGWTDQEVVDLLIASRKRHGNDLKLRLDYYVRTLRRAACFDGCSDAAQQADHPQGGLMGFHEVEQIPHGWRVRLPLVDKPEPTAQSTREEPSSPKSSTRRQSNQKRSQPGRRRKQRQAT